MTQIQNACATNTTIPQGTEIIKEFHKGENFPFKVRVSGEVFNYETENHTAVVAKSILVKVDSSGPMFKFKEDCSWKNFEQMFTGALAVHLGQTSDSLQISDSTLTGEVSLDLNIRA